MLTILTLSMFDQHGRLVHLDQLFLIRLGPHFYHLRVGPHPHALVASLQFARPQLGAGTCSPKRFCLLFSLRVGPTLITGDGAPPPSPATRLAALARRSSGLSRTCDVARNWEATA